MGTTEQAPSKRVRIVLCIGVAALVGTLAPAAGAAEWTSAEWTSAEWTSAEWTSAEWTSKLKPKAEWTSRTTRASKNL